MIFDKLFYPTNLHLQVHWTNGNNKSLVELIESHGGYEYLTSKQLDIIKLANSFLYYKMNKNSKSTLPAIKLAWWHLPEPGNYGDWLSPYIINFLIYVDFLIILI